jgi:hypothetical protein
MAGAAVFDVWSVMVASARVLLETFVDYAGTFPPAGLPLAGAIATYAREGRSPESWMLGRLVLPAYDLRELERVVGVLPREDQAAQWPLSVILGCQAADGLEETAAFNERRTAGARVEAIEVPPLAPEGIRDLQRRLPEGIEVFFEAPIDADLERRIEAITLVGGRAKVRTGGVTAGAFPGREGIVRFLAACADAGLAFKATAGLHHAVRGCYPLTYEPRSETAAMFGFLNLGVAAALVRAGAKVSEAVDALMDASADAFQFGADGLGWRGWTLGNDELAQMRRHFFRSFGSCSFREPVDELKTLGIL